MCACVHVCQSTLCLQDIATKRDELRKQWAEQASKSKAPSPVKEAPAPLIRYITYIAYSYD